MKILGLITEYNPFHNGHKYHLLKSKEVTGATHTIAVMSGNFLQRGDTAIINKWSRAEMAIREGVDLVLELPTLYSCSSAEFFAFGAITLLNKLNLVDYLSFGSESGNIEDLKSIAQVFVTEPLSYKAALKNYLAKGESFPVSRARALQDYFSNDQVSKILTSSNNILGIEYLKAMLKTNSSIKPFTIQRIKVDYHSTEIDGDICSATAIRNFLKNSQNSFKELDKVIPPESFKVLSHTINSGYGPVFLENFEQAILFTLRSTSPETLKKIIDINEGLENRIKVSALKSSNFQTFYDLTSTKRYTSTRIKRATIHALLGVFKSHYDRYNSLGGSQYARVLGFSKKGTEILKLMKNSSQLPIITNISKQYPIETHVKDLLEKDIQATDIYSLGYPDEKNRLGYSEFIMNPFMLDL